MTENKAVEADTSPTQTEDAELSASEMEGVVGGRSSGSRNVRAANNQATYVDEDDKRDL